MPIVEYNGNIEKHKGKQIKFPDSMNIADIDLAMQEFDLKNSPQETINPAQEFNEKYGLDVLGLPEEHTTATHAINEGGAFGFGDEITAGGAALAAELNSYLPWNDAIDMGDVYDEAYVAQQPLKEQYKIKNPKKALAAELLGGFATGGLVAAKLLKPVFNSGSRLAKTAATSALGAIEAALYGAGTAQPGQRIESAKTGAAIGAVAAPVFGATLAGVGRIGTGIKNTVTGNKVARLDNVVPSKQEIADKAHNLYKQADSSGFAVKGDKYIDVLEDLRNTAIDTGFNKKIHPKINAALKAMEDEISDALPLKKVELLRRVLKSASSSLEPDERRIASKLVNKYDDVFDSLTTKDVVGKVDSKAIGKYKQARVEWGKKRKADILDALVEKARNQASGLENGIRTQFRSLLNNPKKIKGFTEQEKAAIQKVVRGGKLENFYKHAGKFGFSEGQAGSMLLSTLGVGAGATLGGGAGAVAVPLIGQLAKKQAQRLTRRNAEKANQLVRGGIDLKSAEKQARIIFNKNKGNFDATVNELSKLLKNADETVIKSLTGRVQKMSGNNQKAMTQALAIVSAQQGGKAGKK